MPNDNDVQHRVQAFDDNLPEDQRNPHAKETFDKLTRRATQPQQSNQGIQAASDDYSEKKTHSDSSSV